MTTPTPGWHPTTHILVRRPEAAEFDIPMCVEIGHRAIGLVATAMWAIDGVYEVIAASRRREGKALKRIDPIVDPCGVAVTAVERRTRSAVPRTPTTVDAGWADLFFAAVAAESISPTPWHQLDHRCAGTQLTEYDATIARTWGCNTCGRDPRTEYTPRFEAHCTGMRLDPRINLDITIAVCPSCHEILHQPLAPTATELMYGFRPSCPQCGARRADIVAVSHDAPLPIGVATSHAPADELPDFICGDCGHEW
jgi:hypothetical protein